MGLLERLGLRKPPPVALAGWLGRQLERIVPTDGRAGPGPDEALRMLDALDQRVYRFHRKYDMHTLVLAIALWAAGTSDRVVMVHTKLVRRTDLLAVTVNELGKRRKGSGKGLILLQQAVKDAGFMDGPTLLEGQ
ncbi:MAG TPA: hypothetical protein VGA78_17615 [Gemmatimonadales bacterium]